jgi:hypothetical protein
MNARVALSAWMKAKVKNRIETGGKSVLRNASVGQPGFVDQVQLSKEEFGT